MKAPTIYVDDIGIFSSDVELTLHQIGFIARMRNAQTCTPKQWQWLRRLADKASGGNAA
jgi:hypothetical protein